MGKILRTKKLTTFAEGLILVLAIGAILLTLPYVIPKKVVKNSQIANTNVLKKDSLKLPTSDTSSVTSVPTLSTGEIIISQPKKANMVNSYKKDVKVKQSKKVDINKKKETKDRENLNVNF